jgi:hypothetical protein
MPQGDEDARMAKKSKALMCYEFLRPLKKMASMPE